MYGVLTRKSLAMGMVVIITGSWVVRVVHDQWHSPVIHFDFHPDGVVAMLDSFASFCTNENFADRPESQ